MKKPKKILSVFLALLMIISIIPMSSIEAEAATLTQSQFNTKLSEVKAMYPQGSQKYEWAINGSVVGWQCHGYGRWLSWYVWGVDFANGRGANWTLYKSTSSSTYIDKLVPGDVVRYRTSTSKTWNHTIFITGISGSTIYYTDCNSDGSNTIKWNQTVSKSTLTSYLKTSLYGSEAATYGYIAHYTPNTLLGPTSCSCSTSYAGTYICTTSSLDLTIRSGHGTSYSAIGSIPSGATVEVSKASGTGNSDWAHVTYNGVSGYASMQYLTKKQSGKERDNTISLWFSNSELGDSVESVRTGEWLYFCYRLFDKNTGDSFDSYITDNYSVKLTIYGPDGSVEHTSTDYDDNSWISIKRTVPGKYTGKAVFTWEGGEGQTYTRYAEMIYEPRITPSTSDVQLNITGTNSKTINISYSGATNSDYIYMDCTTSGDCFSYKWGDWNNGIMTMTITGVRAGSGTITLELRDYDTDELLATKKVYVTVVAPTYTVSYNANGGTGAPSNQTKYYNTSLALSSTKPTRTGYTFLGWSTSPSATSATYSAGGSFTINANTTLYAVWKPNTYTVKYNANGGSGTMSNSSHTYDVSKSLTANNFKRDGYTFLGWSTSSTATSATYTDKQSVKNLTSTNGGIVTLYAVWKLDSSSLTANSTYNATISTGGEMKYYTFTPSTSGKYVIYSTSSEDTRVYLYNSSGTQIDSNDDGGEGNNFRLECDLTAGTTYRFGVRYYNSSKTGTIPFAFGKVYTISYNANGGIGAPSSQSKDYGATLTLSSTKPTRTGYTFLGWSTSSTATTATYSAGGSFTTNANTTLYAVWKANTYTVKYNANGGNGTMSNSSHTYDVSKALTSNAFTRDGYTFLGWSTSSTATNATYTNGQSVKNLTSTNGGTVNLYAVWQKNPVTVSSISIASKPVKTEYYVGDTFNSSGLFVKVTMSDGTTKTLTSGFAVSSPNMLTAGTKTVTVTYSGKTASFTINVKEKAVTPDNPNTNYTFSIQEPSRTTIRNKDGIILHANIDGIAPTGSYVEWSASNNKFKTNEQNNGKSLKIISNNDGYTTFTATLYDTDGNIIATDSIELRSKAGFFDKIGGFFRSLFGATTIYDA